MAQKYHITTFSHLSEPNGVSCRCAPSMRSNVGSPNTCRELCLTKFQLHACAERPAWRRLSPASVALLLEATQSAETISTMQALRCLRQHLWPTARRMWSAALPAVHGVQMTAAPAVASSALTAPLSFRPSNSAASASLLSCSRQNTAEAAVAAHPAPFICSKRHSSDITVTWNWAMNKHA